MVRDAPPPLHGRCGPEDGGRRVADEADEPGQGRRAPHRGAGLGEAVEVAAQVGLLRLDGRAVVHGPGGRVEVERDDSGRGASRGTEEEEEQNPPRGTLRRGGRQEP